MSRYIQFPDLTEIYVHYYCEGSHRMSVWQPEMKPLKATTEFVFGTTVGTQPSVESILKKAGFRHVTSMLNWSPFHSDTRIMKLWWWKNPQPIEKEPIASPFSWSQSRKSWLSKHCQATGCGMKLCDRYFAHRAVYRFFTLMRMPVKPTLRQRKWLLRFHYRHIDTGSLASYWSNGFSPVNYTEKLELRFWQRKGIHVDSRFCIHQDPSHPKSINYAQSY